MQAKNSHPTKAIEARKVSAQNFGVEIYSGSHDQPNGLEEDFSRIMLPKQGISPSCKIRSYTQKS
ncbi:hypothetical protein H6G97_40445 [Nostoc flagelliforme FACHB-838]|uniref:Transposase n=1 Tax=Nostoc flagelliforme FACHB-838 TaxID=2692904 RepID=A0ABR8E452_9NOSO|nr:hypothetical protein [Nostoc flagelliforme FACHB-838]